MGTIEGVSWKFIARIGVQSLFLILFGVLIVVGRLQLWFAIFVAGVFISLFFGRLYCGWVCPINTFFCPIGWIYSKIGLKRIKVPSFMKHRTLRAIPLIVFIALMIVARRMDLPIPALAIMTVIGFLVTLFFEEALWHNAFCPFGTILSITSRSASRGYRVEESGCIACGNCQLPCPVHAIGTKVDGKRFIRRNDCISCGRCEDACPTSTIRW